MKKYLLTFALLVMAAVQAFAVPALPTPVKVTQPDGSTITVRLIGDEFFHYYTTTDGYTIVKNAQGFFTYGQLKEGEVKASDMIAHDAEMRSASEKAALQSIGKHLVSKTEVSKANVSKAKANAPAKAAKIDFKKFRGLILLVQFNDAPFTRSDANQFYDHMVNDLNYTGFVNEDGSKNAYGTFTGSVHDYFSAQSFNEFTPKFDIIGPITVPYSITNSKDKSSQILASAIKQAVNNYGVNPADYDANGDKYVDMFYMIYSGVGSHTGEADDHIWPHASSYYYPINGYYFSRYACSSEYYSQKYSIIDGIGTICHEFSHVLGLPDLYDTDYDTNGQSHDPGKWDVMSGGSYLNYGRTPAAYSAYDRVTLGWSKAEVINAKGNYTLQPLNTTGQVYKLLSPVTNEYFYLENRQKTAWDAELPGHGMIVARVDSTSTYYWSQNKANAYSNHNYYELLRAGNTTSDDLASDPFPGTKGMSMLSNFTEPSIKTWAGKENAFCFTNIAETDGVISFTLASDADITRDVETFESLPATTSTSAAGVEGLFTKWTFTKCNVAEPGDESKANGAHAVAMKLPSQFATDVTYYDAYQVSFRVFNTTSTDAKFQLQYSTDNGASWKSATSATGATAQTASKTSSPTLYWTVDSKKQTGVKYRVAMTAGNKTAATYVDDFTIFYTDKGEGVMGDVNGDGVVNASDVSALVNIILENGQYDINGDGATNSSDISSITNIILGN